MDYYYDEIKTEKQTLDYYNSQKVDIRFKNLKTLKVKNVSVPLSELHDFVKHDDSDLYFLSSENEKKSLRNWLWNRLKKSNIKVTSAFKLNIHVDRDYWKVCPDYFLNSPIGNDDIKVGIQPMEFEIESIEQLEWLGSRGFYYA